MLSAGFVLVGGESSRMGQDKALLPYRNGTLAGHVASVVAAAAGNVTLIGAPYRYSHLGLPVVADIRPRLGPLSGIETALLLRAAEWNLIVACDLPLVSPAVFRQLLEIAASSDKDCVLPVTADGLPQPLAAVWHVRALPQIRSALDQGLRKVTQALPDAKVLRWPAPPASGFDNMNTPEEWQAFLAS